MGDVIKVTVWNEYRHELSNEKVQAHYPDGIHKTIAGFLSGEEGLQVHTATLDEPEHGLTEEVLTDTDVLIWWGHKAHREVEDSIVERVHKSVLNGMGLIVLHSGHFSKIFKKLMGTTCDLKWRAEDEKERMWVVDPSHPIASGIGEYIELEEEEMYGEFFDIPTPDELIFVSWFAGGEVFRSGCAYTRGKGRIFYFRPGHETNPSYHNREVQRVITNGVKWVSQVREAEITFGNVRPLEDI